MDAAHKINMLFIAGEMHASFLAKHLILTKTGKVSSP